MLFFLFRPIDSKVQTQISYLTVLSVHINVRYKIN